MLMLALVLIVAIYRLLHGPRRAPIGPVLHTPEHWKTGWVRDASGTPQPLEQPDDTDIATEGLGWNVPLGDLVFDRIQVRPTDRTREKHHPLGHRTRSWACLPDAEGQIWEAAIRASTP